MLKMTIPAIIRPATLPFIMRTSFSIFPLNSFPRSSVGMYREDYTPVVSTPRSRHQLYVFYENTIYYRGSTAQNQTYLTKELNNNQDFFLMKLFQKCENVKVNADYFDFYTGYRKNFSIVGAFRETPF